MTDKAQEFKHIEPILILDEFTGVKFRSNIEIVNRAINELFRDPYYKEEKNDFIRKT